MFLSLNIFKHNCCVWAVSALSWSHVCAQRKKFIYTTAENKQTNTKYVFCNTTQTINPGHDWRRDFKPWHFSAFILFSNTNISINTVFLRCAHFLISARNGCFFWLCTIYYITGLWHKKLSLFDIFALGEHTLPGWKTNLMGCQTQHCISSSLSIFHLASPVCHT